MADADQWGLCIKCKWWQVEPDAVLSNDTLGQCIEQSLQFALLSITGNSGCNLFAEGEPARAKGSGEQPPSAQPSR